ncbi:hypothetical protein Q4Q54_17750 [Shewanella sp. SP2S2-4]|uniref:hypothetical protein n=1 Tax=Shewanella sp. SP2S2-4 TaxID=3063539 RepID=UPI0028919384|nr:hypothetical protein [Shewanella sp. SP2S2-4]MDT3275309.1 hypothetical protein [Shewanella sp. SP2S2-4]
MGMAATLAMHLRGMPEIEYEVLRKVSEYYFSIPSMAIKEIIVTLAEIEYVKVNKKGSTILSIIPQVPRFKDLYEGVGNYFTFSELNEHEQGTLAILAALQKKPENVDRIKSKIGLDYSVFNRCVEIGNFGNYFKTFRAREKNIIASPFYFADNLDGLVDMSAKSGAEDIAVVLDIIKKNQGWPLSIIQSQLELGGKKLTNTQSQILLQLCQEGILKPPSINFRDKSETFVFTPRPGNSRLDVSQREIYERAMALVSCVRKGQLLAEQFRIWSPLSILTALRDRGYIGSNSEAANQYKNLAFLKVGYLEKTNVGNRHRFVLNKTEENRDALELAINLLKTGDLAGMDIKKDAQIALSKDDKYIQSIISASDLKKKQLMPIASEANEQFQQLILGLDA